MTVDPRHREAARAINSLAKDFERGKLSTDSRLEQSFRELAQAILTLMDLPPDPQRLEHIAIGYHLGAELLLAAGNVDGGIDWYGKADGFYKRADSHGETYGRFLRDVAVTMDHINVPEVALEYALRARKILVAHGKKYAADLDRVIAHLEGRTRRETVEDVDGCRSDLRSARRGDRHEAAEGLVVALLYSGKAAQNLAELHNTLRIAFDEAWGQRKSRGLEAAVHTLKLSIELFRQGIGLPTWLPAATQMALGETQERRRADLESDLLAVHALPLLASGQYWQGIETALAAIACRDEFSLQASTSAVRFITSDASDYIRLFALQFANRQQDIALAVELIESARLQAEPVPPTDRPERDESAQVSRIGNLRPISVGGRSRIAPHYRRIRIGDPLPIERTILAIGGPDAAWWGWWAGNERIFWVLLLDGQWCSGEMSLSEGTALRPLMLEAQQNSLLNPRATIQQILHGPWCESSRREEAFAAELGEAVLPDPLKRWLAASAVEERPLSLVVSGNMLSTLPLPLLGVRTASGTVRRLLEAAVIRIAPPSILVEHVERRPRTETDLFPLLVACLDPQGNLQHSRTPPRAARCILSGEEGSGYDRPTRQNLCRSLRGTVPGDPGLFYYSGHVSPGGLGAPEEDALVLSDDDELSAEMIFDGVATGRGPWFPSRCLLSACMSSGAQGGGSGEWLGLTAAMLRAGARQIVATNWRIWDTPFTTRFDRQLARWLQVSPDAAGALRVAQLAALEAWRASTHDLSAWSHDGLPFWAYDSSLPIIWGAYACVGVFR